MTKELSREIKFRGFNGKNNRWLYGSYILNRGRHFVAPPEIANPFAAPDDFEVIPITVGQFTGLYDCEGREIYEDDNIRVICGSPFGKPSEYPLTLTVVWSSATATYALHDGYAARGLIDPDQMLVVGNVHDLPAAKPPKVYISGPITGCNIEERRAAFARAERRLRDRGCDTVNPLRNGLPAEADHAVHIRADIALLLPCDRVYMLRGWENSAGARLELDVAKSCGLAVAYEEDEPLNGFAL